MGIYVNPTDGRSKQKWLDEEGTPVNHHDIKDFDFSRPERPVCLVNNGPFDAAGVAYDAGELQAFSGTGDHRPKQWYVVSIEKLMKVTPVSYHAMMGA